MRCEGLEDRTLLTALLAVDDSVTTSANGSISGNVLTNDQGDGLESYLADGPTHGSVELNSDGSFTYTPNAGYTGSDTFSYVVWDTINVDADAEPVSDNASVSISVVPGQEDDSDDGNPPDSDPGDEPPPAPANPGPAAIVFTVPENVWAQPDSDPVVGYYVGTVPDHLAGGGSVTYSLQYGYGIAADGSRRVDGNNLFVIDSTTGEVRRRITSAGQEPPSTFHAYRQLNYEETRSLQYTVRATNEDGTVVATPLQIVLTDVDETPEIVRAAGYAHEGGWIKFALQATTPSGPAIKEYALDLDGDGTYDLSYSHDLKLGHADTAAEVPATWLVDRANYQWHSIEDGVYTVMLRITSYGGDVLEMPLDVEVIDLPPVIEMLGEQDTFQHYELQVRARSFGPDQVAWVRVDWGDGSWDLVNAVSGRFSHDYAQAGEYFVEVTAGDEDATGYVGWHIQLRNQTPRPPVYGGYAAPNAQGLLDLTIDTIPVAGQSLVAVDWDFDGDGQYDDATGETVSPWYSQATLADPPVYWAAVRVTDSGGSVGYAMFEFTGAGQVEAVQVEAATHGVSGRPAAFDVAAMQDIMHQLRPDVYSWWMSQNGLVDRIDAQGWIGGWFTWDVYAAYGVYDGFDNRDDRPYLRLHTGFTELEAAQHVIYEAEHGYFASEFLPHKWIGLADMDGFDTVEGFRKWQDWWKAQAANTVRTGYNVIASWYSFQFVGAELVMTATEIADEGISWTHAVDLVPILPFLSKLEIPIIIKDHGGNVVAKVVNTSKGARVFGTAVSRVPTDIFQNVVEYVPTKVRSLVGQVDFNLCTHSCVAMYLKDVGVPDEFWRIWNDQVAHEIDDIGDVIKESYVAAGRAADANRIWSGRFSLADVVKAVQKSGKPAIIGVETLADGQHAVMLDEVIQRDGRLIARIRDPASATFLEMALNDLERFYNDADKCAVFFKSP